MSTSATALDLTVRLRLAARIHFALLRHYGEDVGVSALLKGGAEVREALWVCAASGHAELVSLALQFARIDPKADGAQPGAARAKPRQGAFRTGPAPDRPAPQDAVWAQDTSGFGLSRPADESEPASRPAAPASWLNPASWLRRGAAR